ncbi:ACP S-malonyltransferase [Liquorilactobacillus oeni]|uniref:Malonyl CoA-acyl carrier protein transacylase n=1 Tax=Liquorilactobacillus oeni DSM 19972 TaxID=1423777 RepID=A0A0R1MAB3_9LACO|nr:ACP S-malonyltransferase [Liquorilactobacillus oeni]KRL04982.1 malonyl-CoA-[acyl-carrier-protein] transacylase [Liquorilactobacillus oeni DSM 19972]
MKIGFLFSGQGAQFSSMGLDLYRDDQEYRSLIDHFSEALKLDLLEIYKDKKGQLSKTEYVQPAIVAMSLGIYKMLQRDFPSLEVAGMLGLSLGEYAALIAAKAFLPEDGLAVLKDRARYMQSDADETKGAMAAVIKADPALVAKLCDEASTNDEVVSVANYNTPKQLVIGGHIAAVERAQKLLEENKIKRVIPLKVSGAFHTPLFQKTSFLMERRLAEVGIRETSVPVISNTTTRPFEKKTLKQVLAQQVIAPTHFGDCLQYMLTHSGVDTIVELGPGKTLCKFARQIDRGLTCYHIDSVESYQKFKDAN